jgi:pyridoxine kinase
MNVLSIQSHVAYGHVGNSAAVFPLQRLGFEVWPVHTVQFSNHAGYDGVTGKVFPAAHVREVVEGLAARGVLGSCDGVLSGYLGAADLGAAVLEAVDRVKAANKDALYACDPVMGDGEGGLYVDPALPAFFRDQALPRAEIITPNLFELETLTGANVASLEGAVAAARRAIALGPRIVLVTGLRHEATRPGEVELLAVTEAAAWRLGTPYLEFATPPNGAGDMLAGLFLGHYLGRRDAGRALEAAAAATFAVLAATQAKGARELQLIAAQDQIVAPKRRFAVERVD